MAMTDQVLSLEAKQVMIERQVKALESGSVKPEFSYKAIAPEKGDGEQTYKEYYSRYLAGELTHDELTRWDGDWLKALKEKDKSKKPDIISPEGHQVRRDAIAIDRERPCTDLGNAERLVDQYQSEIRYCHQLLHWYIWNYQEGRWKKDENGYINRVSKDIIRRIKYEVSAVGIPEKRQKALSEWAFVCENRSHINGMIELAQNEKGVLISPDEMDKDDYLFNMRNGTFNLKTLTLEPHNKSLMITKLANYDYDPSAQCPVFLKFLERSFRSNPKRNEIIAYLQRAVGYTLTGSTDEQMLLLLYGSGANGKSVLLNTIRALLDEYATVTQSKTFTTDRGDLSNDIAALAGMRFVCASENSTDTHLDESTIKQLTGGEMISARFLHQEFFTFKPKFKIWWSFNHPPAISDMTISIWRRIKIVPMVEVIPESEWDKNLSKKLEMELPGIFNWAVQGLKEYLERGLQEPEAVTKATRGYKNDQDILLDFFTTNYEFTDNENNRIKASELYAAYKTWWMYIEPSKPMSSTMFGRLCRDRGMEKREGRDGTYYLKIRSIKGAGFI